MSYGNQFALGYKFDLKAHNRGAEERREKILGDIIAMDAKSIYKDRPELILLESNTVAGLNLTLVAAMDEMQMRELCRLMENKKEQGRAHS